MREGVIRGGGRGWLGNCGWLSNARQNMTANQTSLRCKKEEMVRMTDRSFCRSHSWSHSHTHTLAHSLVHPARTLTLTPTHTQGNTSGCKHLEERVIYFDVVPISTNALVLVLFLNKNIELSSLALSLIIFKNRSNYTEYNS